MVADNEIVSLSPSLVPLRSNSAAACVGESGWSTECKCDDAATESFDAEAIGGHADVRAGVAETEYVGDKSSAGESSGVDVPSGGGGK